MQRNKEEESHYRQLLGLSSLTAREFNVLLADFDKLWQVYHQWYGLKGKARMVTKFKEHAAISLRGSQDKLLFILVYLQQNPTQAYHGVIFSMSQAKVSQWVSLLLSMLEKSLHRLQMLPQRTAEQFYLSLKVLAGYFILLDGSERAIPRPVEYER